MPPLGAGGVCVRMTLAAHLHLAQSQALPCLAAAIAFFPLGTRAFLLRVYKCCATDSFLPRKGRHGRYGVEFPQSCSASSFCVAAWLPWSGSVIFFFFLLWTFLGLCWLLDAHRPGHRASLEAPSLCPPAGRGQALSMGGFCLFAGSH